MKAALFLAAPSQDGELCIVCNESIELGEDIYFDMHNKPLHKMHGAPDIPDSKWEIYP